LDNPNVPREPDFFFRATTEVFGRVAWGIEVMSYPNDDDSGCLIIPLLAIGLLVGYIVMSWIAALVSESTGVDSDKVLAWEIGIACTVLGVWLILCNVFVRFSLVVFITALGAMALWSFVIGGDDKSLDTAWGKTIVTGISVGVGALYLFWEARRNDEL